METSIWCLVIAAMASSLVVLCSDEHNIIRDLLAMYPGKEGRPVRHHRDAVDVNVGYSLVQLASFDHQGSGVASLYGWVVQEWTDEYLQWVNSSRSSADVDRLNINSENIWRPDLIAYNALKEEVVEDTRTVVFPNGYVIYVTPVRHDVRCSRFDMYGRTFWCQLRFGSWTYHSGQVNLQIREKRGVPAGIDLDSYTPHPRYHVSPGSAYAMINSTSYDCCAGELYPALQVDFRIEVQEG